MIRVALWTSYSSINKKKKKTFDRVPHKRLVKKLHGYGIEDKLLSWMQAFLTNRTQQVVVGNGRSSWGQVTSGVSQGSVLGSVLFMVYANELPSVIRGNAKMYADDTRVYRPIGTPDNCNVLQEDLLAPGRAGPLTGC